MSNQNDSQVIRERFNTLWPTEQPLVPFTFENVDYTPDEGTAWVRLNILTGQETQVGMGSKRRFRRIGIVNVQIFIPAGGGDGLAKELADSVATIFRGRTVSGVIFRGTALDRVGVDGAWSQWAANTPYQADDLVSIT